MAKSNTAKKGRTKGEADQEKVNTQLEKALERMKTGTLFKLLGAVRVVRDGKTDWKGHECWPPEAWGYASPHGLIYLNPARTADTAEWEYVIAHLLLHLGMGHLTAHPENQPAWDAACDLVVTRFLKNCGIGKPPVPFDTPLPLPALREEETWQELKGWTSLASLQVFSTMPHSRPALYADPSRYQARSYNRLLAESFQESILDAMRVASGLPSQLYHHYYIEGAGELAREARSWFVASYPLLGAVAASFTIVDDGALMERMRIPVAAVSPTLKELYINPLCSLSLDEWKFVLAHEFLHAALRHDARCEGRNPDLWNVACDYVINGWLVQMDLGTMPESALYDPAFSGLSCEGVYDALLQEIRYYTKKCTGDLLYGEGAWWDRLRGGVLDDFYRSALAGGLEYHHQASRSYLPEGLLEEIHAVMRPPIPWDVALARWFDENFQLDARHRSYARMSRRQSSTPDIPRPAWVTDESNNSKIFGVVLDTSGSMGRVLLASALGSIASYSEAREVRHVRVVFCDAAAYDQGVMSPQDIAGTVKIKGRGGTVLQPGIDLLLQDPNFPKDAPILIITDGYCDKVTLKGRTHAFLIPTGAWLPFKPRGKVFRMR